MHDQKHEIGADQPPPSPFTRTHPNPHNQKRPLAHTLPGTWNLGIKTRAGVGLGVVGPSIRMHGWEIY